MHGKGEQCNLCTAGQARHLCNAAVATAVLGAVKEISRLPEGREALKSAGELHVYCIFHMLCTKGIAIISYDVHADMG